MATKYIVNNVTGQTITGGLTISGGTNILSTPPTTLKGSFGDKAGQIAFDENYFYYCVSDFMTGGTIVTGGEPTHVFDAEPGSPWDTYGGNYLQTGPPQEGGLTPLAGWYVVDDNGTIRQVLSDPAWFTGGAPTPYPNGTGWFMILDGPYSYSVSNPTITLYETLPTVSGPDIWKSIKLDTGLNTTGVYRALLTQTGSITGYALSDFNQGLIIGETYTITKYNSGDDFSNIADVQSGTINDTGCVFIATGEIPANYTNGTNLQSDGGLVVNVLENSLGYDIDWAWAPFGGYGYYTAINAKTGPVINSFPRNNVEFKAQVTYPFDWSYPFILITTNIGGFMGKDNLLFLNVWDWDAYDSTNNALYYTPIEIRVKTDITPVQIAGTINPSFPFNNVSFNFLCNGNNVKTVYSNDGTSVNDIAELIALLNGNSNTNQFGVFTDNGSGGVILTTTTTIKQQYCQDNTLTLEVFKD